MRTEAGSVLVLAIVVIVVVVGLTAAFLGETLVRSKEELSERELSQAQLVCDAALEQARRFLYVYRRTGTWPWNDIFEYNSGLSTAPEAWKPACVSLLQSTAPSGGGSLTWPEAPVPAGSLTAPGPSPTYFGTPTRYGNGAFVIVVRDNLNEAAEVVQDPLSDTDNVLVVYVTATLLDGTQRQIEAWLTYPSTFIPEAAILSSGPLKISGNPEVTGLMGSAHSNMWVDMSGNPHLTRNLTASVEIEISGNPDVDGYIQAPEVQGGGGNVVIEAAVPPIPLPDIQPQDYYGQRTYRLTSTGLILNSSDQPVFDAGSGAEWHGFRYEGSGKWAISSNSTTAPAGLYYIEGPFKISGNPTITATFVATGTVEISGNPVIDPYVPDLAVITGGDLKISGNPDLVPEVPGIYVAREQVMISGNPEIVGVIVALDRQDLDSTVSTSSEIVADISGNPRIHYDGGLQGWTPEADSLGVRVVRRSQ